MANVIPVLSEIEFRKPSKWINPNANMNYVHIAYNFIDISDGQTHSNTQYKATGIDFCCEGHPEVQIEYDPQNKLMLASDIDFGIKAKAITIEAEEEEGNGVIKNFKEVRSLVFASKYGEIKDEVADSSAALIKMISPKNEGDRGVIYLSNSGYYEPLKQKPKSLLTGEGGVLFDINNRLSSIEFETHTPIIVSVTISGTSLNLNIGHISYTHTGFISITLYDIYDFMREHNIQTGLWPNNSVVTLDFEIPAPHYPMDVTYRYKTPAASANSFRLYENNLTISSNEYQQLQLIFNADSAHAEYSQTSAYYKNYTQVISYDTFQMSAAQLSQKAITQMNNTTPLQNGEYSTSILMGSSGIIEAKPFAGDRVLSAKVKYTLKNRGTGQADTFTDYMDIRSVDGETILYLSRFWSIGSLHVITVHELTYYAY